MNNNTHPHFQSITIAKQLFHSAIIPVLFLLFFTTHKAVAATTTVSSIAALQTAVNSAVAGDIIILANGTYTNNTLSIATSNITIQSATPGGVFLNGTNAITISGDSITFIGFQFTAGTITGSAITVSGSNNILTQLNFNGYDAAHMVYISGSHNLLVNSNFQNKPAPNNVNHGGTGDMVQIIPSATVIGYNIISY